MVSNGKILTYKLVIIAWAKEKVFQIDTGKNLALIESPPPTKQILYISALQNSINREIYPWKLDIHQE